MKKGVTALSDRRQVLFIRLLFSISSKNDSTKMKLSGQISIPPIMFDDFLKRSNLRQFAAKLLLRMILFLKIENLMRGD